MTDYIIDANVVVKWFLPEPDSDRARAVMAPEFRLRAPDLLVPELANIFWKAARPGDFTAGEAQELIDILVNHHVDVTIRLLPSRLVVNQAIRIAAAEDHSIYDCVYLALAVQAHCALLTADERLIKRIRSRDLKQHITPLTVLLTGIPHHSS
jgi:predicted nucleic acid-binding protein